MFEQQMSLIYHEKVVKFYTPNNMTKNRVSNIFRKEPITITWMDNIQPNEVVLDVGANVGMYTIMAAVSKNARVYAFEPEASNYFLLNQNIKLNNLSEQVTAWNCGVLDYDGQSILYMSDLTGFGRAIHSVDENVNFDLTPKQTKFKQGINVIKLDTFCKNMNVVPDHIKIDVDGLEHRILHGNIDSLLKAKTVIVEIQTTLSEHLKAVEFMLYLGFKLDKDQVRASMRTSGDFKGAAEHLFYK